MGNYIVNRWSYYLSFPERCLRASASLIGGGLLILLDTVLPKGLKGTTLYRILIGDGLRFLIERIAGIAPSEDLPILPQDYHRRKLAGSAIEGLGLLAIQFSPLWIFAIAGDAAAGGQSFLRKLVEQLKQQGVIREDEQVDDLTDLLEAFQTASRKTVGLIDTPPLTRKELEELAKEMKLAYGKVFHNTRDMLPRFERIWRQMVEITASPELSLTALARFMSIQTRARVKQSRGWVKAVGATGTELFGTYVLEGYQRTLDELEGGGFNTFIRVRFAPYRQAARMQFRAETPTWTERKLSRSRT